jgi:hypothetical protein
MDHTKHRISKGVLVWGCASYHPQNFLNHGASLMDLQVEQSQECDVIDDPAGQVWTGMCCSFVGTCNSDLSVSQVRREPRNLLLRKRSKQIIFSTAFDPLKTLS